MTDSQHNHQWQQLTCHFFAWRWLKVSLLVGTILNLINQFDAIVGASASAWPKVALTYCVPYGVASLSAWRALSPRSQPVESSFTLPVGIESIRDTQASVAANSAHRTPPHTFQSTGRRSTKGCD